MKDSKVQLFADIAWALQSARVYGMSSTTSPAPITLFYPGGNLAGAQLLEFLTGVKVMVLVVTVGTVRSRFGCNGLLFHCMENWGWPLL